MVDAEPRFAPAWIRLGELYESDGNWKAAAQAYDRAMQFNPRANDLRLRQGQALLNAGATADALKVLRAAAATSPTDALTLYLLSTAEREANDLDAAEHTARRLIALDRNDLRGPYALAQVFEQRHDPLQVVATLEPALDQATARAGTPPAMLARLLLFLGVAHQQRGDWQKAVQTFERARGLQTDSQAELYLAQALLDGQEFDRALEVIREFRGRHADALAGARVEARVLDRLGRASEGVEVMRAALAQHPDDAEAYLSFGEALADAGQLDQALVVLDGGAARFPGDIDFPFRRGALLERKKRYQDAETAFRQALELDPVHAPTLNYLGYMLVERGERLDEALRLIDRALLADPLNPSYLDSLGWAHFKRRDLQKAKGPLEQAARQLPRNSVVQDHHGDLLMALGDTPGAIAAWERALAGDGESVDLAQIRAKIDGARAGKR